MGLFDRLFGRKEEPKIEEVVKEALENLDLTEPSEEVEALGTEEVEVKILKKSTKVQNLMKLILKKLVSRKNQ